MAFMALLLEFGPNEHPTGDVAYMYHKYIRRLPDEENPVWIDAQSDKAGEDVSEKQPMVELKDNELTETGWLYE